MTILEASNRLVEYFARNDFFHFGTDFPKVCLISDTDADKAAILIALEELAKQQFIIKKDINAQEFWVMVRPLGMQTQDVQISLLTGLQVAETINKYIVKDEDKISPMRISEQDILSLVSIVTRLTQT